MTMEDLYRKLMMNMDEDLAHTTLVRYLEQPVAPDKPLHWCRRVARRIRIDQWRSSQTAQRTAKAYCRERSYAVEDINDEVTAAPGNARSPNNWIAECHGPSQLNRVIAWEALRTLSPETVIMYLSGFTTPAWRRVRRRDWTALQRQEYEV